MPAASREDDKKTHKPPRIGLNVTIAMRDGSERAGIVTGAPIVGPQAATEGLSRRTTKIAEGCIPCVYRDGGQWLDTIVWMGEDYAGADGYTTDNAGEPVEETKDHRPPGYMPGARKAV